METQEILQSAAGAVIAWFGEHRRALPWREDPTPYHIWLSEIMLQQTRIEAVIPYYERFLQQLPTVQALAAVEDDKLMKLWEGLGYYSRARNLKKAAVCLTENFGGALPADYAALKKLPGIGPYTAGAIASIAFGLPEAAVDGNVLRILTRLLAWEADITQQKTKEELTALLRAVYPSGKAAADLTQGLMELGQTICLPVGAPKCEACPIGGLCKAYLRQETERYPVRSPKKARRIEARTVFLLRCGDKIALSRRPNTGLLAGMWEFPNTEGHLHAEQATSFLTEQGINIQSLTPCGEAKHIFTHVEWHMTGFFALCEGENENFFWKSKEEIQTTCAIPSAFRYYYRQLFF